MGLPQHLLSTRPWDLLRQTQARGCNQDIPSSASPRWRSFSEVDLSASVNHSDSCGDLILHPPLSVPSPPLFLHNLPFGDNITHLKDENTFMIGFCNIGSFPVAPSPNDKAQELKTFMALFDLDLFGGSEANLNWSKLPDNLCLNEWFHDIPSCRTFMAHNSTENVTWHQFGGTFWIRIGSATQYITGLAKDPSGLG